MDATQKAIVSNQIRTLLSDENARLGLGMSAEDIAHFAANFPEFWERMGRERIEAARRNRS